MEFAKTTISRTPVNSLSIIGNVWASIGLCTLATATATSRMYTRDHWFSGVILAALYWSANGRSVVRWYDSDENPETEYGSQMLPGPSSVTLVWR